MPRNSSAGRNTKVIDLKGRRVIPGLKDSHLHVIRGGLNYNMELRWDGVPSLADALRMLREQAHAPARPMGARGRRLERVSIRRAPDADAGGNQRRRAGHAGLHPAPLLPRALEQGGARACGYTNDTPNPPGGEIQRDDNGNPTGLLIARPKP